MNLTDLATALDPLFLVVAVAVAFLASVGVGALAGRWLR